MARGCILSLAFLALAAAGPRNVLAEDQSLPDRCWTPQTLAGDLAALRRQALAEHLPLAPERRGSIRSVELPPGEKLIALTFDLCETDGVVAGYDGRIVDILRAHRVKATFFASGKWIETHEERTAQLLADPNFEIGAHGFRHLDMARLAGDRLQDEIVFTEAAYARARKSLLARQCAAHDAARADALPERLTLMRFPFGACNAAALAAVAAHGQLAI